MTVNSTIRTGSADDLVALDELLGEEGRDFDRRWLEDNGGTHHLLVLDAPDGGLAAAAMLVITGRRGHLALLAIARRFEGEGLEDRMIGVVEAMCSAFGAETLDVRAARAA